jgi:hypothetical protein
LGGPFFFQATRAEVVMSGRLPAAAADWGIFDMASVSIYGRAMQ